MDEFEYSGSSLLSLHYALSLARERHFTQAAKNLSISQSALSQQIGRLEKNLGVSLFDRSTNPIGLTPVGKIFISGIENIFSSFDDLLKTVRQFQNFADKILKVGISPMRCLHLLPTILLEFAQNHPEIHISIIEDVSSQLEKMVENNSIDIAILPHPIETPNISYELFYTEEIVLYCSKNISPYSSIADFKHFREQMIEFSDVPLITLRTGSRFRMFMDNIFKFYGIKHNSIIEVNDFVTAVSLAGTGIGMTFAPAWALQTETGMKKVKSVNFQNAIFEREIVVAYKSEEPLQQSAQDFINLALKHASLSLI